MTKVAAALVALGLLSESCFAQTQPAYPPDRAAWIVAQGYSDSSGNPWPGPPWSWPLETPKYGCYAFRQHRKGAWRRVVICE
jgi:hypothetical protein